MRVSLAILVSLGVHLGGLSFLGEEQLAPSLTISAFPVKELLLEIAPPKASPSKVISSPIKEVVTEEKKTIPKARLALNQPVTRERAPVPKKILSQQKTPPQLEPTKQEGSYESKPEQPIRRDVTPAEYASNPPPEYPELSRRKREEGTVFLLVAVRADGTAEAVTVFKGAKYARLNEAAKSAVEKWRFTPASKPVSTGGVRFVRSQVVVPITFALQG